MENTMFSKSFDKDDRPEANGDNIDEIFYRPLCFSGYLTPLQRKKLREKRKLMDDDLEISNPSKIIKLRTVKRTGNRRLSVPLKITKRLKTKEKVCTPPLKYSASKIIRTTGMNGADRKFFKSSSSDRLEKAIFSMPFACKKNVSAIIERTVRQNMSQSKKISGLKERFDTTAELSDVRSDSEIENAVVTSPTMEPQEIYKNPVEKMVFEFEWPSDELLLQRQEQARADLRRQLTSKASLTESKENSDKLSSDDKIMKLYPVFYSAKQKIPNVCQDSKRKQERVKSCWRSGEDQMTIDAGQKEIGPKTCDVCGMTYTIGLDVDEVTHHGYHNKYLKDLLKFPGWKDENVIGEFMDGRIILVRREDPSFKLKKIRDILAVANRDLGCSSPGLPSKPDLTFILFVASVAKQVAGLLVAEPISSANRVLSAEESQSPCQKKEWYSSCESVPAVCGISRIWVSHEYRRHRIASRMIDCLRSRFVYGHVISLQELAFTDPSPDGREFAAAYTGTDHFLVYR